MKPKKKLNIRKKKKEQHKQKPLNDLDKSDLTSVDKDGKRKQQIPY